jgi:hypothetical protein
MKNHNGKRILLSIFIVSMYFQTKSQNYCITSQFNFGGSENDAPVSIIKIADGYVMCGYTNSHDGNFNVPHNHDVDAFIAKFDFNNTLVWQHTYGGKNKDDLWSIQSTSDGGFIATGQTASNEDNVSGNHGGKHDTWVVKTDAMGILQWQRCYGGKGDDFPYEIHVIPGGFQIIGSTNSDNDGDVPSNHGDYDAWLLTISPTGNVISSRCYGGSGFEEMSGIIRNTNGTSTFNAATFSNNGQVSGNHGDYDLWLVNINNNNGSINWQKCIGGSALENPHAITQIPDGNIILSLASYSNDGDFTGSPAALTAKLLKVNPKTGDIIWNKNYPKPNTGTVSFGTLATSNGGILSMGAVGNPVPSSQDAYVFKTDANGNMLWEMIIGGSKSDNVVYWKTGIEINDQYIIPFTSQSSNGDVLNPLGAADGWIVTLGSGCSQRLTEKENVLSKEVVIFPNPVANATIISFSLPQPETVSLKILDANGRIAATPGDGYYEEGNHEIIWNAEEVNPGIYFLQFRAGNDLQMKKLIVTK